LGISISFVIRNVGTFKSVSTNRRRLAFDSYDLSIGALAARVNLRALAAAGIFGGIAIG
jgi:hypothetical protein